MRISVPLTGTLISYNPVLGDPDDPVRIIDVDLGNVSWELIDLDLEHDLALIEVTPAEQGEFPTGETDEKGKPIVEMRKVTAAEKQELLTNIKKMMRDIPVEELYRRSGSARLKKPKVKKG